VQQHLFVAGRLYSATVQAQWHTEWLRHVLGPGKHHRWTDGRPGRFYRKVSIHAEYYGWKVLAKNIFLTEWIFFINW